jgi:phage portal protein BeeE
MPSLPTRLRAAADALLGRSPGIDAFAAASVRPWEEHPWALRSKQTDAAALVSRWYGTVKVASSRTSMAVGSLPLRTYRRTRSGAKYWDARPIDRDRRAYLRAGASKGGAGYFATKMADRLSEFEEITDPLFPVNRLLVEANPLHNGYEMIELLQNWVSLAGNAYWMIAREGSGPVAPDEMVEAWPLAPQFTRPIPSRESVIAGYIYGRGTEIEATYQPEQVVQFRNPNPGGSPYLGMGDLEACVLEADLSRQFVEFAQAMLLNGAQPGLVVAGQFTKDQATEAETKLRRKHEGPRNAGRSIVLNTQGDGKVSVTPLNLSEKEVAFLQSGERMEQLIAGCHDMPVAILRLETAALATAKEAVRQWQLMGIAPRARRIEDTLNQRLIRAILGYDDVFVAFDEAVTRDMEADSQRAVNLYGAEIVKLNEAREMCGLEHVEGGDEFKQRPEPIGIGGFGGGGGGGDGRDGAGDAGGGGDGSGAGAGEDQDAKAHRHVRPGSRPRALPRVTVAALSAAAMLISPATDCHAKCGHGYGRAVSKGDRDKLGVIALSARELEASLRQWFLGGVAPRVNAGVTEDGLTVDLSADKTLEAGFMGATREQFERLFISGFNHGVSDVGSRAPMDQMAALTAPARERMVNFQSRAFQSTTMAVTRSVRASLADGLAAGEHIADLRGRVQEIMTAASNYAAERIARTESARAYLTSREDAWDESGVVKGKEWLLSADPCEFCEAMAESFNTAPLGTPFLKLGDVLTGTDGGKLSIDYTAIDTPPVHPGCRCSLGAIFE